MARSPRRTGGVPRARTRSGRRARARDTLGEAIQDAIDEDRPINPQDAHPDPPRRRSRQVPDNGAPPERPVADPAQVVASLTQSGGEGYIKEFDLRTLHRLLMMNTRLDVVARVMDKSITEITRLRRVLYQRLRHEAANVDMLTHAGRTMAFFNEIRGRALRDANGEGVSVLSRNECYRTAMTAEMDMHKFLHIAGFYSGVKYLPKVQNEDRHSRDADMLKNLMRTVMDPTIDAQSADDLMERIVAERDQTQYLDTDNETNLL